MFSGIIEEIGIIQKIEKIKGGLQFSISANLILDDLKIGDSVSVDGVCLTVINFNSKLFTVDAVGETLNKTTLNFVKSNYRVNLERAVKYNQRIGGHLVQGHINSIARINSIKKLGDNYSLEIKIPMRDINYVIREGSIAINGISLTIADITENLIKISIIPHTWDSTTLKYKKENDMVNIEVDLIAKYIEKFVSKNIVNKKSINENLLKNLGY